MKRRIVGLIACAMLPASVFAEPFEEARVTETINIVSLLRQLRQPQPAAVGDVIKGQTALKTGGESRAELKFPDLTITRVGANSLFRFYAGGRDMTLDGGTMLFYSPKGEGGGKVQAGAVTAAVTGSAFMIMNLSPVIKVVGLEHEVVVSGPGFTRTIRKGQVIDQTGKVTNHRPGSACQKQQSCQRVFDPASVLVRDLSQGSNPKPELGHYQRPGPDHAAHDRGESDHPGGQQPARSDGGPICATGRDLEPAAEVIYPPSPPTPEPTPRRHKPRKPPRPPHEIPGENPGEGGEQGGGSHRRGR